MISIINEKKLICNTIEDIKQKTIEEYDTKINQIMQENNLAKLYYLLAQTFHNTLPQRELGLELLKNNLTHTFFKEAPTSTNVMSKW